MSTRSDIIKEALLNAEKIHDATVERAKEQLFDVFSHKIEESVKKAINESVGVGKDQPSGYNQDEDQDALAFGSSRHSTAKKDDINKGGKGPQKLEGSINVDEDFEDEEEVDELRDIGTDDDSDDLDVIPVKDEELDEMFEDEEDLDETSDEEEEIDEVSDEEELDEKKDEEDLDEASDEEEDLDEKKRVTDETKTIKAENSELKKETKEYKKAFIILKEKFGEVNLLNAKLSGAMKFLRNPNLTLKQKESIVETFDKAGSVREVKLIVHTLNESFKTVSIRKPSIEKPVRSVSSKRLNEAFNANTQRLQELAGLA